MSVSGPPGPDDRNTAQQGTVAEAAREAADAAKEAGLMAEEAAQAAQLAVKQE